MVEGPFHGTYEFVEHYLSRKFSWFVCHHCFFFYCGVCTGIENLSIWSLMVTVSYTLLGGVILKVEGRISAGLWCHFSCRLKQKQVDFRGGFSVGAFCASYGKNTDRK